MNEEPLVVRFLLFKINLIPPRDETMFPAGEGVVSCKRKRDQVDWVVDLHFFKNMNTNSFVKWVKFKDSFRPPFWLRSLPQRHSEPTSLYHTHICAFYTENSQASCLVTTSVFLCFFNDQSLSSFIKTYLLCVGQHNMTHTLKACNYKGSFCKHCNVNLL